MKRKTMYYIQLKVTMKFDKVLYGAYSLKL